MTEHWTRRLIPDAQDPIRYSFTKRLEYGHSRCVEVYNLYLYYHMVGNETQICRELYSMSLLLQHFGLVPLGHRPLVGRVFAPSGPITQ